MLLAALKRARETGRSVCVVVPDFEVVRPCALVLSAQDYGGIWNAKLCEYKTHSDVKIYLMPMKNQAVRLSTLHVANFSDEDVFWDHEVVRVAHNRALQEFHRYD
jgi:hypothetical protein